MRNFTRILFLALIPVFFAANAMAQTVHPNFKDGMIFFKLKDNVLIRFHVNADKTVDQAELPFLEDIFKKYQITKLSRPLDFNNDPKLLVTFQLEFADINNVDELVKELAAVDMIEYAEKVARKKLYYTPNDPYYNSTASGMNWGWHLDQIKAHLAWDILQSGSSSIKVAVVDNAVWAGHEDLNLTTANQYNAVTSTAGNSAPPTSIGQACTVTGGYPSESYEWSHGTHCMGNVGATNNNGIGVASIGGGVTLMGVRCADNNGEMWSNYLYYGVQWAGQNGADVISMSFGGTTSQTTEQNLMNSLNTSGVVLFGAAGNDGLSTMTYPAAYSSVIAVGSSDNDKALSDFSQYGSWVDIAAPGGYLNQTYGISELSTTYCNNCVLDYIFSGSSPISGNYDVMQGTSMSCPITAGLAGLMLSLDPTLTPAEIKSCMQSTAMALTGGNAISSSGGIIDAQAAMQCVQGGSTTPPTANFSANPTATTVGSTVLFTDLSSSSPTSWSWSFSPSAGVAYVGGTSAASQNPQVTFANVGSYSVTLTATNQYGASAPVTKTNYIVVSTQSQGFSLDFEACTDFSLDFSPWTTNDVDLSTTYGITNTTWLHSGEAQAFIAYNPASTTPAITDAGIQPHGGSRYGACFAAGTPPNNDWLISPQITLGSNASLSLWVKSYVSTYGLERYKIGVSTTTNNPASFTIISSGAYLEATTVWEQKTFSLAAYNGQSVYVGINCVSNDAFIFMIDDIVISTTTSDQGLSEDSRQVQIFPNPTTGLITIDLGEPMSKATITIHDVAGALVMSENKTNADRQTSLDISNLSNGFYYVTIITEQSIITKKVSLTK